MLPNPAHRAALAAATCVAGVLALSGCVTTVPGSADYSVGTTSGGAASSSADPQEELKKQCAVALTTAKGFLDSWKTLASSGITPTADQRNQLAAEVQGYIDQLNSQIPTVADAQLVANIQAMTAEMVKIVEGLQSGIAVELTGYRTAVNTTTTYCQ